MNNTGEFSAVFRILFDGQHRFPCARSWRGGGGGGGERKRASGCLARVMYLPERKGHLHTADSTCTQPAQGEANGSALVLPSDRWKSNLSFIHPGPLSRRIIGISSRSSNKRRRPFKEEEFLPFFVLACKKCKMDDVKFEDGQFYRSSKLFSIIRNI